MDAPALDQAAALAALDAVDFNPTRALRSVWHDPPDHVTSLNQHVLQRLLRTLAEAGEAARVGNPRGLAITGQAGAGKTHLLGALRAEVWRRDGWFVLLHLLGVTEFWTTAALGYVEALARAMPDGRTQGQALLGRLAATLGIDAQRMDDLASSDQDRCRSGAQAVLAAARRGMPAESGEHRDAILAFACLHAGDADAQDFARSWLQGVDIGDAGRSALGLIAARTEAQQAVSGLSWLMSLAGPTLCAIDQIDAIVSVTHLAADDGPDAEFTQRRAQAVIDGLAGGLMSLFDLTHRTVTVVSALGQTWEIVRERAVHSAVARFHDPILLRSIGDPHVAREMIARRLAGGYARAGFEPPYATWPYRAEAFEGTVGFTPRALLQRCEQHRDRCLAQGAARELVEFGTPADPAKAAPIVRADLIGVETAPPHADIDARFAALLAESPPHDPMAPGADPKIMARLLRAGLQALVLQDSPAREQEMTLTIDAPGLHAMLRIADRTGGEPDRLHAFCVLTQTHHLAVQPKLRAAIDGSGIDRALPFRHLYILRRGPFPAGKTTVSLVQRFEALRGQVLSPADQDLLLFHALAVLLDESPIGLDAWLRDRRPVAACRSFRAIGLVADVPSVPSEGVHGPEAEAAPAQPLQASRPTDVPVAPDASALIPLGVRPADGASVALPLAVLPRHVAIVAGSGSGKTVLLRRIVEESALLGVPSIVIDSNNDLVRLGDPWPDAPQGFSAQDTAKAARLRDSAEFVVWTPNRPRGNPLVFAPLPDFAAIRDDQDERDAAIDAAGAALQPLISSGGSLGRQRRGVLMDALRHFARSMTGRLDDLIALLRDLPPDVSRIDRANRFAADVANDIDAARSLNPMLDGAGTPTDPHVLLHGAGGRTRVSVVNLAGLASDESKQDFVARLLMALFGYIRRHPATPERPVVGQLVMDEAQNFAPSLRVTSSRQATAALARQARKYGLGMVFATQAPRAIDSAVIGNCTTQVFGRLNAPAALDAARELMAARGGSADDLGRLDTGTFYLSTDGTPRPFKFRAPLCLTHHPQNPPSEEDVLARAAQNRPG